MNKFRWLLLTIVILFFSIEITAVSFRFEEPSSGLNSSYNENKTFSSADLNQSLLWTSVIQGSDIDLSQSAGNSILSIKKTDRKAINSGNVSMPFTASAPKIYSGFDAADNNSYAQSYFDVPNRPRAPGDPVEPWTPIGDGIILMLLLLSGYVVFRLYRK